MLTRRWFAVAAATLLLLAGIVLFFLSSGVIWLKVFSGFMAGTGATRLVVLGLLARQSARAPRATPR